MPDIEFHKKCDEANQAFGRFKARLRQEGQKLRGDTDYRNLEKLSHTASLLQSEWLELMAEADELADNPSQQKLFDQPTKRQEKAKAAAAAAPAPAPAAAVADAEQDDEEQHGAPKPLAWLLGKVRAGFITAAHPVAMAPRSFAAVHAASGVDLADDGALCLTAEHGDELAGVALYMSPEGCEIDGYEENQASDVHAELLALVAGKEPSNVVQFEYEGQPSQVAIYAKPKPKHKGWLYVVRVGDEQIDTTLVALVEPADMKDQTPMGKAIALLDEAKAQAAG